MCARASRSAHDGPPHALRLLAAIVGSMLALLVGLFALWRLSSSGDCSDLVRTELQAEMRRRSTQHKLCRCLRDAIFHRRYTQWPLLAVRLRDVFPQHRPRAIRACLECVRRARVCEPVPWAVCWSLVLRPPSMFVFDVLAPEGFGELIGGG